MKKSLILLFLLSLIFNPNLVFAKKESAKKTNAKKVETLEQKEKDEQARLVKEKLAQEKKLNALFSSAQKARKVGKKIEFCEQIVPMISEDTPAEKKDQLNKILKALFEARAGMTKIDIGSLQTIYLDTQKFGYSVPGVSEWLMELRVAYDITREAEEIAGEGGKIKKEPSYLESLLDVADKKDYSTRIRMYNRALDLISKQVLPLERKNFVSNVVNLYNRRKQMSPEELNSLDGLFGACLRNKHLERVLPKKFSDFSNTIKVTYHLKLAEAETRLIEKIVESLDLIKVIEKNTHSSEKNATFDLLQAIFEERKLDTEFLEELVALFKQANNKKDVFSKSDAGRLDQMSRIVQAAKILVVVDLDEKDFPGVIEGCQKALPLIAFKQAEMEREYLFAIEKGLQEDKSLMEEATLPEFKKLLQESGKTVGVFSDEQKKELEGWLEELEDVLIPEPKPEEAKPEEPELDNKAGLKE